MIRRFGFVVVLVSALIVSACGRQVTPDKNGTGPGNNLPPGFMQIKFRVAQPFDYSNYSYVVVFNTTGDGSTPTANGTQTAYRGYSFAIILSGVGGSVTPTAWYFFRQDNNPSTAPILQPIQVVGGQLIQNLNSNGQNTEFSIIFNRALASAYSTPTPSPTGSASPSTSPSASPTVSPSASPSGSPSASPSPTPTAGTGVAPVWTFNYFVVQGSIVSGTSLYGGGSGSSTGTIIDSLGLGGPTDATYVSRNLDTTTNFDTGPFYPAPHANGPPSSGSATLAGGDISNNP